ncbi:MAG: hypothetical protein ACT4P1_10610 [Sporichthyaceae bacterium]
MSSTHGEDISLLEHDCARLGQSIQDAAQARGWTWDVFVATQSLRPPSWGNGVPDGINVAGLNLRLLACSDALAVHGFKGGSFGLGQLISFARGQNMPTAVFHHTRTALSRMLVDDQEYTALLDLYQFDNEWDIHSSAEQWVGKFGADIQCSPDRRKRRDTIHGAAAQTLRDIWISLDPQVQAQVCVETSLPKQAIEEYLSFPALLADLRAETYRALIDALEARHGGREPLVCANELAAWREWSTERGIPTAVAHLVLNAASRERLTDRVRRDSEDLRHTGGWDQFAERYLRGDAGA